MRINGIHIDGFGIYSNENNAQNLPEGVIVFLGNNEGGKTTLMEYIRFILFGLPKKAKNEYRPLNGGKHGGRLSLTMQDGHAYTVERLEKKVTIVDDGGKSIQGEPSDYFFNGKVDRSIFESIFAIGLDDMKGLGILSNESVRSWTLTGAGAFSLPKIMGDIDKKLKDILKPRAGAEINDLLGKIKSIKAEIRQLQLESSGYTEQQNRLIELETQVKQNREKVKLISQRLRRIEQLEQARNPWLSLCAIKEKLEDLEDASDFPPKGLERFETSKEEIETKTIEKNSLENNIKKLETQSGMMQVDENIIAQKSAIESLMRERQKIVSAIEDQPVIMGEMRQKENYLNKQLQDLGTDWDPEKLAKVDTSIQARHRVQAFSRDLGEAEIKHRQIQDRIQNLQEEEKEAGLSYEEAQQIYEKSPNPAIKDIQEIKRQRDVLRNLNLLFHQNKAFDIQLEERRRSQQEIDESISNLEKRQRTSGNLVPSWSWIAILGAGIVISALLAIFSQYIFSPIVLVLMGAMSFLVRHINKRSWSKELEHTQQTESEIKRQKEKKSNTIREINEIEGKIKINTNSMNDLASSIDLNIEINQAEMEKMDSFLDQAEEMLRDWLSKEQKEKELRQISEKAQERLEKSRQEASDSQNNLQELQQKWSQWVMQRGFDENIRPDGFDVILQMVEKARDAQDSLQESSNRVKLMSSYIDEAREKIRNAMMLCNMTPIPDEAGATEIDKLNEALNSAIENKRKQDSILADLDDAKSDFEKISAELDSKQTELDSLLKKARANSEDDFRIRAELYEEWVECKRLYDEDNLKLMTIAGNAEALANLISELGESDPALSQSEKEKLTSELQELESQYENDNREIGGLKNRLEGMLQDEDLSRLLFEQKSLQEQLKDAVKRWATLTTTRFLLEKARNKFERERQPRVIQEAKRYVKAMTSKPYNLVMPVGETNIQLENEQTLLRKDENGWSSGLADQVYLAIRLGLACEFAQHTEPLPIIFDDVFVRFDPTRQLGIAKVMLELANQHQILVFSCHPEIRDIMEGAKKESGIGNVSYYRINDGSIRKE